MKTKTKLFSLLVALLMFLVSIAGLGIALNAKADFYKDYKFPEPVPDSEYVANPDENLTSLYYFSDCYWSEDYFNNGFVRQLIDRNPNITSSELYYCGDNYLHISTLWGGNFWGMIDRLAGDLFPVIENAFIIFEVRQEFPTEIIKYGEEDCIVEPALFYQKLYDIFEQFQENGCKVMFISGTDEVRYAKNDYNAFLDFVDIHIDVDYWTTYLFSILSVNENSNGDYQGGVAYLFDTRFSLYNDVYKCLIQYLLFNKDFPEFDEISLIDFSNTRVLFYDGEKFYNPDGTVDGSWDVKLIESDCVSVIGDRVTSQDEYLISVLEGCAGEKYTICEYAPFTDSRLEYYISVIMRDFILNDIYALDKYNNIDGRCPVTFMPLFYSKNGWMRRPKRRGYLDTMVELPQIECNDQELLVLVGELWGKDKVWGVN